MPHPLRDTVKADFYPFAERQGFERLRRNGSENVTFRRRRAEFVDVFEIQWDRKTGQAFSLNLGQFDAARGERKGIDALNCEKPVKLQFSQQRGLMDVLRTRSLSQAPAEVVAQLLAQFAQAEAWWLTKTLGPDLHQQSLSAK